MILNSLLMTTSTAKSPNSFGLFLPIILIFLIMYFLIFRPQMKRQKEQKKMIESVKQGDKIISIGGIYGTVVGVKESSVIVKVSENSKIEFARTAIARIINEE